ncbi:MAG TPA: TIGR00730 family Rossman fold protein [Longimicrobium sp.]|jgi:hypothetical protein
MEMKQVCVFCGSSAGTRPVYAEAARAMGRLLAERGIGLVYGGGKVGLMGEVADAVLAAGGEVTGVIPRGLMEREVGHRGLTTLHVTGTMHERKALMVDLSDGFVALPGGYGTLDELCEALTWSQLGIHARPCGVLNVDGYFDALLALFDHAVREGFVREAHRGLVLEAAQPAALLDAMARFQPPTTEKWIRGGDR